VPSGPNSLTTPVLRAGVRVTTVPSRNDRHGQPRAEGKRRICLTCTFSDTKSGDRSFAERRCDIREIIDDSERSHLLFVGGLSARSDRNQTTFQNVPEAFQNLGSLR
jgi:hypothetical protein